MPNDATALTLQEQLEDVQQKTARELYEKKELLDLLKLQVQFLSEPEQKVLDMHYNEGAFLSEIARRMRIGQSKVWQMHAKAIEKIRRRIVKALGE
jgi:RNA polymerase sigma factor for flagellar operon FliA